MSDATPADRLARELLATALSTALSTPPDEGVWARVEALTGEGRAAVVHALRAEVDRLARTEPPAALAAADVLVRAARGVPAMLDTALRGRAVAAYYNEDFERAAVDYFEVVGLYERAGRDLDAARVRRSLVDVLQLHGRVDKALEQAALARRTLERLGERRLLAEVDINEGNAYTRLDEYDRASARYRAAAEALALLDDPLTSAIARYNLALVEMNANRLDEAARAWEDARTTFEAHDRPLHVADCDYSLAYLEARRGRYADALRGLEEARGIYERNGKPHGPGLCDLDLAEICLRLSAFRDARRHAEAARDAFRRLGKGYELAKAELFLGLALARLGERDAGLAQLDAAAERFRGVSNHTAALGVAVQYAAIAVADRPAEAAARLRGAVPELERRGVALLSDLALLTLARAELAQGVPRAALALLEELLERGRDERALDALVRGEAWRWRAAAELALDRRDDALESLRRAIDCVEEAYDQLPADDVRVAFFRDHDGAFTELAWHLAEPGDARGAREALAVLERSRSRSLLGTGATPAAADPELVAVRERLDWLVARQLDAGLGADASHQLRVGAPALGEVAELRSRLKRAGGSSLPGGGRPRFGDEELSLATARGDVLVAYLAAGDGVRAFVADGDDLRVVDLPARRAELVRLRQLLWLQVDKARLGDAYVARQRAALERSTHAVLDRLGELLVAPFADRLDGRRVLVVPFDVLHDLPFHAFRVGGEPLVERCDLSYAVSTWHAAELHRTPGRPATRVLAIGEGGAELPLVDAELRGLEERLGERFERLPADGLAARLAGLDASGAVLHLAAHGLFAEADPSFSGLVLGSRTLLARDLAALHLPFELAVLSGCETGRRRRVGGDELLGLTGALLRAGTRAAVGSAWAVSDDDALAFAGHLYDGLGSGDDARTAVCRAHRALRRERPHPLSWAAFAALGDPSARLDHS